MMPTPVNRSLKSW